MTMWTTKTTKFKESEAQLQSFSNQVNILWPKNLCKSMENENILFEEMM